MKQPLQLLTDLMIMGIDAILMIKIKKDPLFIQNEISNQLTGSISEGYTHKFIRGIKKLSTLIFQTLMN